MFIINLEYSKLYFEREFGTKDAFSFDKEWQYRKVSVLFLNCILINFISSMINLFLQNHLILDYFELRQIRVFILPWVAGNRFCEKKKEKKIPPEMWEYSLRLKNNTLKHLNQLHSRRNKDMSVRRLLWVMKLKQIQVKSIAGLCSEKQTLNTFAIIQLNMPIHLHQIIQLLMNS